MPNATATNSPFCRLLGIMRSSTPKASEAPRSSCRYPVRGVPGGLPRQLRDAPEGEAETGNADTDRRADEDVAADARIDELTAEDTGPGNQDARREPPDVGSSAT